MNLSSLAGHQRHDRSCNESSVMTERKCFGVKSAELVSSLQPSDDRFYSWQCLVKTVTLVSSITLVNTMSSLNHVRLCFYTVIFGVAESPGQVRSSVEINEGEIDGGT